MSEEIRTTDANLRALHADRAALRTAAQTAGITLWYSTEDEAYIAVFPAEPILSGIGDTPGAALFELLVATRMGLDSTRADLDTLRNGVAWLGGELERVKAWARVWKRAAKRGARDWRDLVAAYEDMRAENAAVRRVARVLVAAWRQEQKNEATARSMGWELYGLLKDWQTCEEMREPGDTPCGVCQICRALAFWKTMYRKDLVQPTAPTEPPTQPQGGAAGE